MANKRTNLSVLEPPPKVPDAQRYTVAVTVHRPGGKVDTILTTEERLESALKRAKKRYPEGTIFKTRSCHR